MKGKFAPAQLKRVVLHVNTYLPNLEGYHAQRLEVVKACLTSMTQGAHVPYTLVIYDAGSISELLQWIETEIKPDILIKGANYGKVTANKMVTSMFPENAIMCYSDDDMLFADNWLLPQIDLLETFPNVACVSGYPVRTSFRWGNVNTKAWAKDNAILCEGRFISDEHERDFCESIGRDYIAHAKDTANEKDYLIEYKGKQAYATSHHCQVIGYAGIMNKAMVWDNYALGSEREFDVRLDQLGLRLATTDRLARHIGNILNKEVTI